MEIDLKIPSRNYDRKKFVVGDFFTYWKRTLSGICLRNKGVFRTLTKTFALLIICEKR